MIELHADVRERVRAVSIHGGSHVSGPSSTELEREIERTCASMRERHAGRKPSEIAELAPARTLYKSFGIDPTRTRPSSESLLRRVLKGESLPRISSAVDLSNLLALRFLLPIGLYDTAAIAGRVVLRAGTPGESYAGIRKSEVHLAGRPVLADETGPFGNPTSDSARTCVTTSTSALLLVVFAPTTLERERVCRMRDDAVIAAGELLGLTGVTGAVIE